MNLNLTNKLYVVVGVLITTAIAVKLVKYKPSCRFYYAASACAPETFPVYIKEMYFITGNNEIVPVNTEEVNYFKSRWGKEDVFPETTAPHLLPEKLVLKYAGFREGDFYNDTILLPFQKLKAVYDSFLLKKNGIEIYYKGGIKKGLYFLVGVANNGHIVIWLRNGKIEKEILRATINAREPAESDTYYGEKMSAGQYLENRFGLLNDSMKIRIKSGYDAQANYIDSTTRY